MTNSACHGIRLYSAHTVATKEGPAEMQRTVGTTPRHSAAAGAARWARTDKPCYAFAGGTHRKGIKERSAGDPRALACGTNNTAGSGATLSFPESSACGLMGRCTVPHRCLPEAFARGRAAAPVMLRMVQWKIAGLKGKRTFISAHVSEA